MTARTPSRRQAREYALAALYQADLAEASGTAALAGLWEALVDGEGLDDARPAESDEIEFATRLVQGVTARRDALDALIEDASRNWRLRRMPVVDRNILRIAAFELAHCPDIPGNVSVNEAVELAKRFGGDDSRAFVNGLVDRIGRELGRLEDRADKRKS